VGSTLYTAIGALERGRSLKRFDDIDLRVSGVSVSQAVDLVRRVYPGESTTIERGVPYINGVVHLKVTVPRAGSPLRVDLSVYPKGVFGIHVLDKAHQWVTFTKLKLELPKGVAPSFLLDRLSRPSEMTQVGELRDPSGRGLADLMAGVIHVDVETGMPKGRVLEGLLQTMYVAGKTRFAVDDETLALFGRFDPVMVRGFFDPWKGDSSLAPRRSRYLVNAFKPTRERRVGPSLDVGRRTGLWTKLFPELGPTTTNDKLWSRLVTTVVTAHKQAITQELGRAFVFGALLAPLSKKQLEQVLPRLKVESEVGDTEWLSDLLAGHRTYAWGPGVDRYPQLDRVR